MADRRTEPSATEWMIRTRSRVGTTGSVHYGSLADIEWHARAAAYRQDVVEDRQVHIRAQPESVQT